MQAACGAPYIYPGVLNIQRISTQLMSHMKIGLLKMRIVFAYNLLSCLSQSTELNRQCLANL